jgi:hypothetical protein
MKRLMIRADMETNDRFEALSLHEHASVNALYEKALRRYIEWDVFADKIGLVQISLSLWKFFMNKLTDAEVRELGRRSGGDASVEFITSYFHRFDLDTVLESFRLLGDQYMHNFKYTDFGDASHRTVILHHKAGPHVSAYYAEVFKALCEKVQVEVRIEESDDQIVLTIRDPRLERETQPAGSGLVTATT